MTGPCGVVLEKTTGGFFPEEQRKFYKKQRKFEKKATGGFYPKQQREFSRHRSEEGPAA